MNNNGWTKEKLLDISKKLSSSNINNAINFCYIDGLGFFKDIYGISIKGMYKDERQMQQLYYKTLERYEPLETLEQYVTLQDKQDNNLYYYDNTSYTSINELTNFQIYIRLTARNYYRVIDDEHIARNYYGAVNDERIPITSKQDLEKIEVWHRGGNEFVNVKCIDMRVGEEYFYNYNNKGKCRVTEVYKDLNKEKVVCEVEFADKTREKALYGDTHLVHLPWNEPENELNIFSQSLNAIDLQAGAFKQDTIINVYWLPIKDAVRYIVKLYKYKASKMEKELYFLKNYEVNRNENFISINDIIGSEFYVVVCAENREGDTIAQSLGIGV